MEQRQPEGIDEEMARIEAFYDALPSAGPLTDEELADVEAARAEIARGDFVVLDPAKA
jgi:hypothetical protein